MAITTPSSIYYTDTKKGDVFSVGPNWGEKSITANNNEVWVKGDLLQAHATTGVVSKALTGSVTTGKFCVAARPKTLTSAEGIVFGKDAIDKIALEMDGIVVPNHRVKPGVASGTVDSFVDGTTVMTADVGTYVGHGPEVGSGDNLGTNSADGDIGVIEINPANWL
jgi:hypothetical protein